MVRAGNSSVYYVLEHADSSLSHTVTTRNGNPLHTLHNEATIVA